MKQSKEERAKIAKQWQQANKDKTRAACRRHYAANKEHFRFQDLYKRFGLTKEQYWNLMGEQNGLCKICGRINDGARLFVDHKHVEGYDLLSPEEKTKLVRGLLCHFCNTMLGYARDNPAILQIGISYLESYT